MKELSPRELWLADLAKLFSLLRELIEDDKRAKRRLVLSNRWDRYLARKARHQKP